MNAVNKTAENIPPSINNEPLEAKRQRQNLYRNILDEQVKEKEVSRRAKSRITTHKDYYNILMPDLCT